MSRDTKDLVRMWHPRLPVVVIGDRSQDLANDNLAKSENRLGEHAVVGLNATEVQPPDSTGQGILEPRRVTAKRGLSGFWRGLVEFFIEGLALYGASIHPSAIVISHVLARKRDGQNQPSRVLINREVRIRRG